MRRKRGVPQRLLKTKFHKVIAFRLSSSPSTHTHTHKTIVNSHREGNCFWAQLSVAFKSIPVVNAWWFLYVHLTKSIGMGSFYTSISTNSFFELMNQISFLTTPKECSEKPERKCFAEWECYSLISNWSRLYKGFVCLAVLSSIYHKGSYSWFFKRAQMYVIMSK